MFETKQTELSVRLGLFLNRYVIVESYNNFYYITIKRNKDSKDVMQISLRRNADYSNISKTCEFIKKNLTKLRPELFL